MSEDQFIDSFLEQYYYYESIVLEDILEEYSSRPEKRELLREKLFREELIELISERENKTVVEISMRGKNIENTGGYMHFRYDAPNKKEKLIPPFMREYKVGIVQYYLFWPVVTFAILETVVIIMKIVNQ